MKSSVIACTMGALLAGHLASAQTKNPKEILTPPPANVKIDGSLDDWADSLRYYNEEKKLNFTLANDKDNLYMAIRVNDRTEQIRIMQAGITFGINTKGSKKDMYSLTFPGGGQSGGPGAFSVHHADGQQPTQEDRDEMLHARLTKLHDIKVTGFKSIEGDMITTTNTYGIKAAMNYDADGYLVCEMEIPFKLFDEFNAAKKEWAFNFKINAMTRPTPNGQGNGEGMSGGGMRGGMGGGGGMHGGRGGGGGMGGGMRGGRGGGMGGERLDGAGGSADRAELFKSVDFWEKFWLGGF